jgi:ribonuclease Y
MDLWLAIAVGLILAVGVWAVRGRAGSVHAGGGERTSTTAAPLTPLLETQTGTAMGPAGGSAVDGARELALLRERLDTELRERRAEIRRFEERVLTREESLEARMGELDERERSLLERQQQLQSMSSDLEQAREQRMRELERVGTMSRAQARQALVSELEGEARHEAARTVRQVEEEARLDADRRVRSILSACMQRVAAGHAAETTVSVVQLQSDDMKGRIIGR